MTARPQLAVIIPVYRDTAALVRLLGLLKTHKGVDQIIVSAATVSPKDLGSQQRRQRCFGSCTPMPLPRMTARVTFELRPKCTPRAATSNFSSMA